MEATQDRVTYINAGHTVRSWLLTIDHKRIALLYLVSITFMFLLGGMMAGAIRLELLTPPGDLLDSDTYNKAFTLHGIIMIFFFLIPSIPATLGNFLVPIMVGAKDLAFPKINLLSWYIYIIGATIGIIATLTGGLDTGWTLYTPYSTAFATTNVILPATGLFITGFSSILTGFNFIVTIHKMRAPGLTWFRLPLFVWAQYATSLVMVLGTPVIAITILMVILDRCGFGIFDPKAGGDPVLFQHLFWFYSHPAVYIMILPAMGVISEVIPAFTRKKIFGYGFIAASSLAIAIIGFLVWGHHLFTTTQSMYAATVFSVLTFAVAIPSAVKVFNWAATMYKGSVSFESPMIFAIGFMGLFLIGGLTGLFLAILGLDLHVQDTYFVVAHFHYIMVGGAIMGYMAGLHYWWPKISGKKFPEVPAKVAALLIFIGFNGTFFPQFIAGYAGMPRRYHYYPPEYQVLNVLSTMGAGILGIGYLMPLCYFMWSLKYGEDAGKNPWGVLGLEWTIDSPPHPHNFHTTPIITSDPYDYPEMAEALGAHTGHAPAEVAHV
ncbi:MAG TPA: cbb3-type cytochrome c oxidase subunit I [Candidatus Binatia bacterium]|jgi:cytochrome c oxidase subunit 1